MKPADDLIHATRTWAEADIKKQINKNYQSYSTIGQKMNELKSTLDTHTYEPEILRQSVCGTSTISGENTGKVIACKTPSRVTKIKDLSSNLLGQDVYAKYANARDEAPVVELVV